MPDKQADGGNINDLDFFAGGIDRERKKKNALVAAVKKLIADVLRLKRGQAGTIRLIVIYDVEAAYIDVTGDLVKPAEL